MIEHKSRNSFWAICQDSAPQAKAKIATVHWLI